MLVLVVCLLSFTASAADASNNQLQQQPTSWQEGVLCRAPNKRITACTSNDDQRIVQQHKELAGSRSWPLLITDSSGSSSSVPRKAAAADAASSSSSSPPRFAVLARLLRPTEANVRFAQAFCISIGGRLAYWSSPKEYASLAALVRTFAAQQGSPVYAYVGAVQLPGSKAAAEGWVWLHKPSRVSQAAFPWAAAEPNDHNEGKAQGHSEDCAVLASYHKASEANITDDFPCNYGTPAGKFQFNGHNPHLTVACRLGQPKQNL
jgi:hypothetical protein